jgi:hypothetical protein
MVLEDSGGQGTLGLGALLKHSARFSSCWCFVWGELLHVLEDSAGLVYAVRRSSYCAVDS